MNLTATSLNAMLFLIVLAAFARAAEPTKIPVTFSGGHELGKNDFGRPCTLMAAALSVKPDEFRFAFSGVTPARGRGPTGADARSNKEALMKVLAPLGVTNERMDEVANYYRFRPQNGELWPTKPAEAYAIVEDGKIKEIVITNPGSGYCSPPVATVKGFEKLRFLTNVHFDTDLKKNGSIEFVEEVWEEDSPNSSKLPPAIRDIQKQIRAKPYDEVRSILKDRLGSNPTHGGIGIGPEWWHTERGSVHLDPWKGVTFITLGNGANEIHLQTTRNSARMNLIGGYEMTEVPSQNPKALVVSFGDLEIHDDLTYSFTLEQSNQFPEERARQKTNYFFAHPQGTVKIEYTKGVTDDALLESLPTDSVVASLNFQSADGKTKKTFTIKSNEPDRRLEFADSSPLSFFMDKSWENWGQKNQWKENINRTRFGH